ncbi:MAG: trypsin-like peptidase domain-containing protein [candidate division WOR-3 bacterium]|nr:trypsin-like peptidase domain-containing protein [candidate division WOR-3 bacterium]MCX7757084.1 trypsin-like peptidase domain-containing protein [candidate division WOR-3 bacterium]MDW7987568.1 trypsin-like peptidase domain-containing protein [candidate division WOR-3 bacterium]
MRRVILYLVGGISIFLGAWLIFSRSRPLVIQQYPGYELIQKTSLDAELNNSRVTAIVRAAQKVSPAVVSITVIQERIVTTTPFFTPFSDPFFDEFFRDFFPRRQYKEQVQSLGSGVIINKDGDIITNAHVVEKATKIKVTLPDDREFDGEIIDIDPTYDLALVRIKGKDLPFAVLGNSDDLMIGEWCIALGNPFGFLLEDAHPTVTVGVISALNRTIKSGRGDERVYRNMIQTDAAINPGNSGGPLVNALGEVIGINTFIFSRSGGSEGIGFAIPINVVKKFIKDAQSASKKRLNEAEIQKFKTKIGLVVADNNYALMRKYQLNSAEGVVVLEVERNSIGEILGVAPGDIIISLNNERPKNAEDFARIAQGVKRQVDLVIDRQGEQIRMFYRF